MINLKSKSTIMSMVVTLLEVVTFVIWIIYAATYSYFNVGTLIGMILCIICSAVGIFLNNPKLAILPLVATICIGIALAFFGYISLPVWQDGVSGFNMYGSRGGMAPVIVLTVFYLVTIIASMVRCFMKED